MKYICIAYSLACHIACYCLCRCRQSDRRVGCLLLRPHLQQAAAAGGARRGGGLPLRPHRERWEHRGRLRHEVLQEHFIAQPSQRGVGARGKSPTPIHIVTLLSPSFQSSRRGTTRAGSPPRPRSGSFLQAGACGSPPRPRTRVAPRPCKDRPPYRPIRVRS